MDLKNNNNTDGYDNLGHGSSMTAESTTAENGADSSLDVMPTNSVKHEYHADMHVEFHGKKISDSPMVHEELLRAENEPKKSQLVNQFNGLRTKQLIVVVLLTILTALINNWINQQSEMTTKVLSASFVVFLGCYKIVASGRVNLGGLVLLWSLYFTLTLLMLSNEGLRDPVTIGYAGILIFAAMLGNKQQFLLLTVIMGASFIVVGYINQQALLNYQSVPFGWGTVVDLLIIYSVISYAVWTLATDLRFALSRLEIENLRINKSKQEFKRKAHYDYLTGLPNRIIALDRFKQSVFHAHRSNAKVAVLFLDLDNFKTVNDSLGHSVGDRLLQDIATRLLYSVREGDTVCRLGGDEFLVILDSIQDEVDITVITNHILTNIARPINLNEHQLTATCSIGIAISPVDGEDFDELRKKADMAMYRAKNAGRNGFMFFDEDMNKDMLAHIDRINGLRNAISNREFVLHYQPKVDLSSGKISSAEALIRWQTSDGSLITPDEFIPIAENTGLIIEIGEWVLYEACRQCKKFQNDGLLDFSIAVNLSAIQFRRGNLQEIVNGALGSAGLDPSYLELEVTESLLIEDSNDIRGQIKALQTIGVTFSIDDFGTGYSSLSYLRDFNFDFLKIDRSFIQNSVKQDNDMVLCEAIIGMAHKLKLMVVAEGIETSEQQQVLFDAGCEFAQGNYFSPPLPVATFYQLSGLIFSEPPKIIQN
jgi:diguanylate cyclase (GGDEF)-like protein